MQLSCCTIVGPFEVLHRRQVCLRSQTELALGKVMAVAFTAYAFDSNVENGGNCVKLGLDRVQAARVAFFDTP
jgi:hypothetical protein